MTRVSLCFVAAQIRESPSLRKSNLFKKISSYEMSCDFSPSVEEGA